MHEKKAFTLNELLVVLVIVSAFIAILISCAPRRHRGHNMMKNGTQIRSIIQAMLTFANSNKEFLPGRETGLMNVGLAPGEVAAADIKYSNNSGHFVNSRYALLLEGTYFGGDIMLSPGDTRDNRWTTGNVIDGPDDTAQFSYSMLEIDAGGGRRKVWDGGSISSSSPIIADRLISGQTPKDSKSYWLRWASFLSTRYLLSFK